MIQVDGRTLHVKPSSSVEREVHFDSETDQVEVKEPKHRWSKRRKSDKEVLSDSDPLVTVTTKELFLLNKPDWYLVIIGVIATGILGSLFPMMSILFSGMLEVCVYSTYYVTMQCYYINMPVVYKSLKFLSFCSYSVV